MKKRIMLMGFHVGLYGNDLVDILEQQDLVPVEHTFLSCIQPETLNMILLSELVSLVKLHHCQAILTPPTTGLLGQIAKFGLDGEIKVFGLTTKEIHREDIPEDKLRTSQHMQQRQIAMAYGFMPSISGYRPQPIYSRAEFKKPNYFGVNAVEEDYSSIGATVTMLDLVQIGSFDV